MIIKCIDIYAFVYESNKKKVVWHKHETIDDNSIVDINELKHIHLETLKNLDIKFDGLDIVHSYYKRSVYEQLIENNKKEKL